MAILLIPFYYIHIPSPFANNPRNVLEDVIDAFTQIGYNPKILMALLGTTVSIALFNFAGISIVVTQEISTRTRVAIGGVRTTMVWIFSMLCFGQKFSWLQVCLKNGYISCLYFFSYINYFVLVWVFKRVFH